MRVRRLIRVEDGLAHYVEERILKTIKASDLGKILEDRAVKTELLPYGTVSYRYDPDSDEKILLVAREPQFLDVNFVSITRTWRILLPIHIFRFYFNGRTLHEVRDYFMTRWPENGGEAIFRVPFPNRHAEADLCEDGLYVPERLHEMSFAARVDLIINQVMAAQHNLEIIEGAVKNMPVQFRAENLASELESDEWGEIYRDALDVWEDWSEGKDPESSHIFADLDSISWNHAGVLKNIM
jgi:hypothetical protein